MMAMNEKEFQDLTEYVKCNYGINLANKKTLIEGRLYNLLMQKGYRSYGAYFRHIITDYSKEEIVNLLDRLTTNHTFFMRETEHFDFFRTVVLPQMENLAADRDLRIWSAGCSTGQEPYTLAMIMNDYFGNQKSYWDTKILATDISTRVIEAAKTGVYSEEALKKIPVNWKNSYFKKAGEGSCQITEKIRSEVIYRIFNLMDEVFPFHKKFHAIFCRNVMIYFDEATKAKLIQKFYDLTEAGGYLFIGHSESINKAESDYQFVMPAVYRKV